MRLSKPEQVAFDKAGRMGMKVLRNGWPDFLAFSDGRAMGIEVKSGRDRVSPEQAEMFAQLEQIGITVVICRGTEFSEWRDDVARHGLRGGKAPKIKPKDWWERDHVALQLLSDQ